MKKLKELIIKTDFTDEKSTGSRIERAMSAVGKIDHTFGVMKPDCYLHRHNKKNFVIKVD